MDNTAENLAIYRKAILFLKKSANVSYPISVRRLKLNRIDGLCEFKNDKFIIKINRNLTIAHSIDVAIHEVAHAMSWGREEDIHGEAWGISYSQLYRKFLDDFIDG